MISACIEENTRWYKYLSMISLIKFGDINTNITKFEVLMDGFGLGKYVSDIKSGKDVTINDSNSNLSGGEK